MLKIYVASRTHISVIASLATVYPEHQLNVNISPERRRFLNFPQNEGPYLTNVKHLSSCLPIEEAVKSYDLFFASGGWTSGWKPEYSNLPIPKILYWHNIPLGPDRLNVSKVAVAYESFKVQRASTVAGTKVNLCRNPDYWSGWHGNQKIPLVVALAYKAREPHPIRLFVSRILHPHRVTHMQKCGSDWWIKMQRSSFSLHIHSSYPPIPIEQYREMLRSHRVFLMYGKYKDMNGGFVTAAMVGMPLVVSNHPDYNIIMKHGEDGFIADSPQEAIHYSKRLLEDEQLAREYSIRARKFALKHFSPEACKPAYDRVIEEALVKF